MQTLTSQRDQPTCPWPLDGSVSTGVTPIVAMEKRAGKIPGGLGGEGQHLLSEAAEKKHGVRGLGEEELEAREDHGCSERMLLLP